MDDSRSLTLLDETSRSTLLTVHSEQPPFISSRAMARGKGAGLMIAGSLIERATAAYVFGSPLVSHLTDVRSQTANPIVPFVARSTSSTSQPRSPSPISTSAPATAEHSLRHGPLRRYPRTARPPVPDTANSDSLLQCIDPWTTTFACIGSGATDTKDGAFLFAPHSWDGPVPDNVTRIVTPRPLFTIRARYAVSSPDDLPAVTRSRTRPG